MVFVKFFGNCLSKCQTMKCKWSKNFKFIAMFRSIPFWPNNFFTFHDCKNSKRMENTYIYVINWSFSMYEKNISQIFQIIKKSSLTRFSHFGLSVYSDSPRSKIVVKSQMPHLIVTLIVTWKFFANTKYYTPSISRV